MKLSSTLLLLTLASLVLMATSRPLTKRGRMQSRRQHKRQASETEALGQVPRYIQELYTNLTKEDKAASGRNGFRSEANTYRSLQNVSPDSSCDLFNFSLSEIGTHEKAVKSELNLYMERNERTPPPTGRFCLVIKKYEANNEEFVTLLDVAANKPAGWIKFNVQHVVAPLIPTGESNVVFKVQIYPSAQAYHNAEGVFDCADSPVSFVSTSTDDTKAPYLTIDTYDFRIEQIDYKMIFEKIEPDNTETAQTQTEVVSSRKRRQAHGKLPACRLNNLNIATANIHLPDNLLEGKILLPVTYNAGICGGQCGNTFPMHMTHSQLVHMLVTSQSFEYTKPQGMNTDFEQSCSPVQFSSLVVIFLKAGSTRLVTLNNMRITKCDCLEVLRFSKAR